MIAKRSPSSPSASTIDLGSLRLRGPLLSFLAIASGCAPPLTEAKPTSDKTADPPVETASTTTPTETSKLRDEIVALLRSDPELAAMIDDAPTKRLQLIVGIPGTDHDGQPILRRVGFRAGAEYFYPASSVKLCAALGAVEKLEDLRAEALGRSLTLSTPLRLIDDGPPRRAVDTTLKGELEKALILSDNEAHNRLFDFVGREELAERLDRIGVRNARIVHPLGEALPRTHPPLVELLPGGQPLAVAQHTGFVLPPAPEGAALRVGRSHLDENGKLIREPMDFATKNIISLRELQDVLLAIARPDMFRGTPPRISRDRDELLGILSTLPSKMPAVARMGAARAHALDELHKPLHLGVLKALPNDRVKVFGKGGRAYGFTVENSYAIDETTGRWFFVAATIYTNDSHSVNDDRYEYDSVASPFLGRLGEVLARGILASPSK